MSFYLPPPLKLYGTLELTVNKIVQCSALHDSNLYTSCCVCTNNSDHFQKKVCVLEMRSFCKLYMDGGTVWSDCLEAGYTSGEHIMFIGQCVKQEWMYVITLCESITHISVVICKF